MSFSNSERSTTGSEDAVQPWLCGERRLIIASIEQLISQLIEDIVINGVAKFRLVSSTTWRNYEVGSNGTLRVRSSRENNDSRDDDDGLIRRHISFNHAGTLRVRSSRENNDSRDDDDGLIRRHISFNHAGGRHRFTLVLYVLAAAHRQLLVGGSCSPRELYYNDTQLTRSQGSIERAIHDVSGVLLVPPWKLGIIGSGKGLIAGALRICMTNGDIIDCSAHEGATLVPQDFGLVERIETTAAYALLVEKDTVFAKLLSQNIFAHIGVEIVLITGKGYPDLGTRMLVQRLHNECRLPIYTLVDADPYGVEIMLVYRHGSRAMARSVEQLACPQLRWIGVHPSELQLMAGVTTAPLSRRDGRKLDELLQRSYIGAGVRRELQILQRGERKAQVEAMTGFSLNFLIRDYIPNKIRRNLLI